MSDLLKILKSKQTDLGETTADVEMSSSTVSLDEIQDRAHGDTRGLNAAHVEDLASSIALLGLIEPLVVDNQNRLLAGGHRRAAIAYLQKSEPKAFAKHFPDGVPVHRLSFDSEKEPELALEIEISENEKRRDFNRSEVKALAEKLRRAGYTDTPGRPKKGEKRLRPALELIVGKSLTTLRRYLNEEETEKTQPDGRVSEPEYGFALRQCQRGLSKWLQKPRKSKREREAVEQLKAALGAIEKLLGED